MYVELCLIQYYFLLTLCLDLDIVCIVPVLNPSEMIISEFTIKQT